MLAHGMRLPSVSFTTPRISTNGNGASQFQKEKWLTSPTYLSPSRTALPSSIHVAFSSSNDQRGISAGESALSDPSGNSRVALLPSLKFSAVPSGLSNSTAIIP